MTRLDQGEDEESIRSFMRDMYLTSKEKIDLSVEVAKRERELLSHIDYETGYSLYVGIPFCPTTCLYCSFTSYPIGAWEKKVHLYLEALFKELDYVAEKMKGRTLDTVYFGGGTPTSLKAEELDALLTKIENTFDLSKVQEFTVEAGRPDSITEDKFKVLPCPQYLQDLHQSADDEAGNSGSDRTPPHRGYGEGKIPHGKRSWL